MKVSPQRRYEAPAIELSQIPIGHYYLLRADNERSKRYVSSLIGGGSLTVRESEVWRGKTGIAQTGAGILHTIDTQIHGMFRALGLPEPETDMRSTVHQKTPIEINKWVLSVGSNERLALFDICRESYRAQRYWHCDTHRWAQALIPLQPYSRQ